MDNIDVFSRLKIKLLWFGASKMIGKYDGNPEFFEQLWNSDKLIGGFSEGLFSLSLFVLLEHVLGENPGYEARP